MYTKDEVFTVVDLLKKYHKVANKPDLNNNIIIVDGEVQLLVDGQVVKSRVMDVEEIHKQINSVSYSRNIFANNGSKYSPLEADRKENKNIWKEDYKHIDFPKFMSMLLFSLLEHGKVPDIIDCCNIYLTTYTGIVKDSDLIDRHLYMTSNYNDRFNVGNSIEYDGKKLKNVVRRFNGHALKYVKGLPFNEFTTEQMCFRIYKVYGSGIRDIDFVLRLGRMGHDTYYSFMDDLHGFDGFVDGIPYYGYTKTNYGNGFWTIKGDTRHKDRDLSVGIMIKKSIKGNGGVYLYPDDVVNKISKEIKNDKVNSLMTFEC